MIKVHKPSPSEINKLFEYRPNQTGDETMNYLQVPTKDYLGGSTSFFQDAFLGWAAAIYYDSVQGEFTGSWRLNSRDWGKL